MQYLSILLFYIKTYIIINSCVINSVQGHIKSDRK